MAYGKQQEPQQSHYFSRAFFFVFISPNGHMYHTAYRINEHFSVAYILCFIASIGTITNSNRFCFFFSNHRQKKMPEIFLIFSWTSNRDIYVLSNSNKRNCCFIESVKCTYTYLLLLLRWPFFLSHKGDGKSIECQNHGNVSYPLIENNEDVIFFRRYLRDIMSKHRPYGAVVYLAHIF